MNCRVYLVDKTPYEVRNMAVLVASTTSDGIEARGIRMPKVVAFCSNCEEVGGMQSIFRLAARQEASADMGRQPNAQGTPWAAPLKSGPTVSR